MNAGTDIPYIILLPHYKLICIIICHAILFEIRPSWFFSSKNRRHVSNYGITDFGCARCTEMNAQRARARFITCISKCFIISYE